MSDKELDEMKATGEDSKNMEPVTPAGGDPKAKNRKADVDKSVDPNADEIEDTVKTPQGSNNEGLKEAFEGLFEGADLSEDFKNKTFAIFEAAVHEKLVEEKQALEEKFEADLQEQVEAVMDNLNNDVPAVISVFAGRIADTGTDPAPLMRKCKKLMTDNPNWELLWASPRELLNIFQAAEAGVDIITVPPDLLGKTELIGKDHEVFSLETVKMFFEDAKASRFSI